MYWKDSPQFNSRYNLGENVRKTGVAWQPRTALGEPLSQPSGTPFKHFRPISLEKIMLLTDFGGFRFNPNERNCKQIRSSRFLVTSD